MVTSVTLIIQSYSRCPQAEVAFVFISRNKNARSNGMERNEVYIYVYVRHSLYNDPIMGISMNIFTCLGGCCVTYKTRSVFDDWIY
jgi:hypothetical protein